MESWGFLTNHARVLLRIAQDPGMRLRDIAADLGITERSAHSIVNDLTAAGYVLKQKDGRRNRYQIQAHLPLPEPGSGEPAIGDVLAVIMGRSPNQSYPTTKPPERREPGGTVPPTQKSDIIAAWSRTPRGTELPKSRASEGVLCVAAGFAHANPGDRPSRR